MLRFTDSGRTLFTTDFGPVGLVWTPRGVARVIHGDLTTDQAAAALAESGGDVPEIRRPRGDTAIAVRRLKAHLKGRTDDLRDVPLDLRRVTPFAAKVLRTLRRTGPGDTISYGALARRSGRPSAARAVGRILGANPVPLLAPCHRCLAADGSLTGFSSPGGLMLKARLLHSEGYVFDPDHERGRKALMRMDPVMRRIIPRVGPYLPNVGPTVPAYDILVRAIVHQQLSVKAGQTILGRVRALTPGAGIPTPAQMLVLPDDELRGAGLSWAKAGFVKDLAARVADGRLRLGRLSRLDDEEAIAALTSVKGIGRWSAQMHLMFHLRRLDVLPVDDVGLQNAAARVYGLGDGLTAAELGKLGEQWRPWRSLASWYLWRIMDMGGI